MIAGSVRLVATLPGNHGRSMTTRLIKKYPNRRLYDTQTSSYITLADVKQLVLDQEAFRIADASCAGDITWGSSCSISTCFSDR